MNTSSGGLGVYTSVYSTMEKAIEKMKSEQKEICKWNSINFEEMNNDFYEDGSEEYWGEYTHLDEGRSEWHYSNVEDDYYIDIRILPDIDNDTVPIIN